MTNEELQEHLKYSLVFQQLLQSERFTRFFEINYDLHKLVNEEEKEVEFRLIELPPEEAEKRLMALMTEHAIDNKKSVLPANEHQMKQLIKGIKL